MKRWLIRSIVFITCLAIGLVGGSLLVFDRFCSQCTLPLETKVTVDDPLARELVSEFVGLPSFSELELQETSGSIFKLNEDGIYSDAFFVPKDREEWLVLTESDGKYSLVNSRASVKTSAEPGSYDDFPDVEVSFPISGTQMFAVSGIPDLRPGPVQTLYWDEDTDDSDAEEIAEGYRREFTLNGQDYILRVTTGLTIEGVKTAVMVLETNGRSQVVKQVHHSSHESRNFIGTLLWAGDLDGDGKLDLYFREFVEKCGLYLELHLSSLAEHRELLALAAQ